MHASLTVAPTGVSIIKLMRPVILLLSVNLPCSLQDLPRLAHFYYSGLGYFVNAVVTMAALRTQVSRGSGRLLITGALGPAKHATSSCPSKGRKVV
jgi:hypothetical protein